MTQLPSAEAVVGNFEDTEYEWEGKKYSFYREGEEFRVRIQDLEDPEKPIVDKPFVLTTGSHHFQAYWLPSGNTRALDVFPLLYRIADGRWMPLASQFIHPPGFYHDFNRAGAWNVTCNRCHTTHSRPRIEDGLNMDSYVAEFGISCESCHGPAEQHVANAHENIDEMAIIQPEKLTPIRSAQVCGSCHGALDYKTEEDKEYWRIHGFPYRPGDDLLKHRSAVNSGKKQYWPDGMLRVSGREYNGLTESPCFKHHDATRQMTCLSCHQMHQSLDDPRPTEEWANDQLKYAMDSNIPGRQNDQACIQCHEQFRGDEALTQHTHHAADSTGSRCYNCHMPHTTWGVMKAMRSHTVSSPSVKESLHPIERPNACNLCHLDKTLKWTATKLNEQYGQPIPELVSDEQAVAASLLWGLKGDAGQRALVAWSMGWTPALEISGGLWMAPVLAQLLEDPYYVVRSTAYESLKKIEGFEALEYDFVGSSEDRRAAKNEALRIWRQLQEDAEKTNDPATLRGEDGRLMQNVFNRLLRRRNNEEVFLEE